MYYENLLKNTGIENCPTAYRKIPITKNSKSGKCNINFAKDAFDHIKKYKNCIAIALDISGYFENIDHKKLYSLCCRTLGVDNLPADYEAIFKNITKYRYVEKEELYKRLGYFGLIEDKRGKFRMGFTVPYKEMRKQLCTPKDFREKVCGKSDEYSSLIMKNTDTKGIPQGAPISDLFANIYLMDYDKTMAEFAKLNNGVYWRYSDDILLILPDNEDDGKIASDFAKSEIKKHGDHLQIKPEKTSIVKYCQNESKQECKLISGEQGKNGLEYLGFRYDGNSVFLRDSTVSGFYRKLTVGARKEARTFANRNPHFTQEELIQKFNYKEFYQRYSRVNEFEKYLSQHKSWTFWTYVKRSARAFDAYGNSIISQMSRHKKNIKLTLERELVIAHQKTTTT